MIGDAFATLRRQDSTLEPPVEMPGDPWLVPVGLFRTAQAEQIRRNADSMAVRHDGEDLAANMMTQGLREGALSQLDLRSWSAPARIQAERMMLNESYRLADGAVAGLDNESWRATGGIDRPGPASSLAATVAAIAIPPAAGIATLGYAVRALGPVFDGKRFVKYLTVRTSVFNDSVFNGGEMYHGDTRIADAGFEEMYADLPRPIKLLIDELSPGSIAMTLAGGALVKVLGASANPAAKALLAVFRPMSEGAGAFPRQVAAGVGLRAGYEYTDGAPMPVRIATSLSAAMLAGNPAALLDSSSGYARNVWRALVDNPTGPLPATPPLRAYVIPPLPSPNPANVLTGLAGATYGAATGEDVQDSLTRAAVYGAAGYAGGSFASRAHRTPIDPPDIIPFNIPTGANGVRLGRQLNPVERFGQTDAIDYASDLAQQMHDAKLRTPGVSAFSTETEVPPPVAWALQRSREAIREGGQAVEQFIEQFPVTKKMYSLLKPSAAIPTNVRQAYWGAGATEREIIAHITPSRVQYVDEMVRLFGGTDDANVRYIGTSTRALSRVGEDGVGEVVKVAAADYPLTGKVYDVLTHPSNYDLSEAQRGFIPSFDFRNSSVSEHVKGYGVEIGDFGASLYEQLGYHFGPRPAGERARAFLPIVTRESRPGQHVAEPRQAVSAGRLAERKYIDATGMLADPAAAGTEIVTDVAELLFGMDEAKARAAGRQVLRWGIGGQIEKGPGLKLLDRTGTYVSDAVAEAVSVLERDTDQPLLRAMSNYRGLRFNGDGSPLTRQGVFAWAASPIDTSKAVLGAIARGEMADMMSPRMLADEWARNPEQWMDFAFHMNIPVRLGTPEEFSAGFLERLPIVGSKLQGFNDGMFNLNLRAMKRMWERDTAYLIEAGVPPEAAKAAAADTAGKVVPLMDPRKLGMSPDRTKWESAIPNSASWARQPIAFVAEALTGMVKIGLQQGPSGGRAWAQLTPNESLAVRRFTALQGTLSALAVTSAIITAKDRNLDRVDAMQRAIDPDHPEDFLRLWITPTFSVPMGEPYRGMVRAVWPREITGEDGETHLTPFAGMADFIRGRVKGPALSAFLDLAGNRDYLNKAIIKGNFPQNVWSALAYAAENIMPIAFSEPIESQRLGLSFDEGKRRTAGQLAGASGADVSPYQATETSRRGGFQQIQAQPERAGMTPEQQQAALGATTIDDLRARIGTRAANMLTEQNAPDFPESYARWVESTRRRAAAGDPSARASLVGVDLQERLTALATEVTQNGQPDKEMYRTQRGAVIDRSIGANQQYEDVFARYRKSPNEIDQLSAQWYDLMKQSRQPSGSIDFETFNKKEEAFFAGLKPETASLVRSNVESIPRGANPLETELRQIRGDLESTGFFKIETQEWEKFKAASPALGKFDTFAEYRADIVTKLADAFKRSGMTADVALQFADRRAQSAEVIKGFDAVIQVRHAQWDKAHPDIAQQAIGWGYLSASAANVVLSGSLKPSSEPSGPSAAEVEIIRLWETGLSYGKVGQQVGKTDGAVEQILRRHYGGSPTEARKKLSSTTAP